MRKFFLSLILLLFVKISYAQDITGNLEGRISDTTGAPLSGVNITVQSDNLQGIKGTVTYVNGSFKLFYLPIGNYMVKVSMVGFRELVIENVQVRLGKTTYLGNLTLSQEAINLPEVTVSGERNIIDPTLTTYGGNLQPKDFDDLPVSRDYKNLVTLLPQANTSYYGDGVNIGGSTGFENKYFVDGIEVTEPLGGWSGMGLPYNFIQEIELKAGGYDAEYRSSLGGLINVVTFSGSNDFHGSVFGFYTSNQFTGYQTVGLLDDPSQGDFNNYDIGFSIRGPILADKLWFSAAYNPTFENHQVKVPSFGTSTDKLLTHAFATKLTWSPFQKLGLILTVIGDPTEMNTVGRGVLVPPASLLNPDPYFMDTMEGNVSVSLNATYSINDQLFITGSISRLMHQATGEGSTQRGKEEVFFQDIQNNIWSGGVNAHWDAFRHSNIASIKGSYHVGTHKWSLGAEYKLNGQDNQYEVHTITKINDTTYYEDFSKGYQTMQFRTPSIYFHDRWQIINGLVLNFSLRWEGQYIYGPDGQLAQYINIPLQPRVGLIFVPDEKGFNKIYGSYGRFSQELSLAPMGIFSDQGYWYSTLYKQDPRIDNSGGVTVGGQFEIQPEVEDLRGQFYDEFSLGYERLIWNNFKVSVQGLYRTLGEALDDGYSLARNEFSFGNPGKYPLIDNPRPMRDYAALIISVERRGDEHFNFLASYVLSRDYGNYEGLFDAFYHSGFPNANISFDNPFLSSKNTSGLVPNDRTHVFKFSGSYRFLFGLTTGIAFVVQSGTPLSEYSIGFFNTGLNFISQRGSAGRTPTIWDLSARFTYELPLLNFVRSRLILDLFHIASQREPVDIDQLHYFTMDFDGNLSDPNPTYGQAYRYQQPMSMRLGMEVNF
jgi:hypothetical protein